MVDVTKALPEDYEQRLRKFVIAYMKRYEYEFDSFFRSVVNQNIHVFNDGEELFRHIDDIAGRISKLLKENFDDEELDSTDMIPLLAGEQSEQKGQGKVTVAKEE